MKQRERQEGVALPICSISEEISTALIIHIRFYYLAFQQYITFRGNTEVKVLDKVRT